MKRIHMELDKKEFVKDFHKLIERYGRSKLGFKERRKMRFWAYPNLTKSDLVQGLLTTVCER